MDLYLEFECDELGCHTSLIQRPEVKPPNRGAMMDESDFTAMPKGWVFQGGYRNMGIGWDPARVWEAGWCHVCKERCDECACKQLEDIFDSP